MSALLRDGRRGAGAGAHTRGSHSERVELGRGRLRAACAKRAWNSWIFMTFQVFFVSTRILIRFDFALILVGFDSILIGFWLICVDFGWIWLDFDSIWLDFIWIRLDFGLIRALTAVTAL